MSSEHIGQPKWERLEKTISFHMSGEGYRGDYEYVASQAARKWTENTEVLDLIAGLEDMEELDSRLSKENEFIDAALTFYRSHGISLSETTEQ